MSPFMVNKRFPVCGPHLDGLSVTNKIPNVESIWSSYHPDEVIVLAGVREIPTAGYEPTTYSKAWTAQVADLAEKIKDNGWIDPLIIGVDDENDFIIEGNHRIDALLKLKKTHFPALVVVIK